MLSKVTDHVEQGLALLLEQYQGKPRLAGILSAFLKRVQELEDAAWDVYVKRLIDNAENAQLDRLGAIVGEPRQGRDDATYRLFILARVRVNMSFGHADDIIAVLLLVEAEAFSLTEYFPATVLIEYAGATSADPAVLVELARMAKSGGVRLQLTYGEDELGVEAFSFIEGTTDVASSTEGFASSDESDGGYLSGVLE